MARNLSHLVYSCSNAIFNYLKDSDVDRLIEDLSRVEEICFNEDETKDETKDLWFKFGDDDTAASTIFNVHVTLLLPPKHPNHILLLEQFNRCIGLEPENEIRVYYS